MEIFTTHRSKDGLKKIIHVHSELDEKDIAEYFKKENPGYLVVVEDVSDWVSLGEHHENNWEIILTKIK